jgi:hypothetical protein
MLARTRIRLLLLLAATSACATSIVGVDGTRVPTGTWGGDHLALTVTGGGAHLEFDCASGDITAPLTLDSTGRLDVDGVFIREHGGPTRADETPEREPARYSGRVEGQTMTLDVTLTSSKESVGTFTLTLGAEPRVRKCR